MILTIAVIGRDKELLKKLKEQQTEHTEVITAPTERKATKNAQGKYITFVYPQDDVKKHYMSAILTKIDEEEFDVCFFGWEYMNWHGFKFIGFVDDFKPFFSAIFRKEKITTIRKNNIHKCLAKMSKVTKMREFIYSYRGERG